RLKTALAAIGGGAAAASGPVVVLVMDKAEIARYQGMAQALRQAGVRAEMYLGSAGMKAQMKYADKRGAPGVGIQGSNERAKGEGAGRKARRNNQGGKGRAGGPPAVFPGPGGGPGGRRKGPARPLPRGGPGLPAGPSHARRERPPVRGPRSPGAAPACDLHA